MIAHKRKTYLSSAVHRPDQLSQQVRRRSPARRRTHHNPASCTFTVTVAANDCAITCPPDVTESSKQRVQRSRDLLPPLSQALAVRLVVIRHRDQSFRSAPLRLFARPGYIRKFISFVQLHRDRYWGYSHVPETLLPMKTQRAQALPLCSTRSRPRARAPSYL
jgi:hypothetical protein